MENSALPETDRSRRVDLMPESVNQSTKRRGGVNKSARPTTRLGGTEGILARWLRARFAGRATAIRRGSTLSFPSYRCCRFTHPDCQTTVHRARNDRLLVDVCSNVGLRVRRSLEGWHGGIQLLPGVARITRRPKASHRGLGVRRTADRCRPSLRGKVAVPAQAQPSRSPCCDAVERCRFPPDERAATRL